MVFKYNFELNKGSDHTFSIRLQDCNGGPINLLGYRVKMQIRQGYSSGVIDELSIANERITLSSYEEDGMLDTMEFTFPKEIIDTYPIGNFLYDLKLQSSNLDVTKILEGQVKCLASITL